ncbi:hypothetical protein P154DRAFT_574995 [Amniculicola lignicola CBS 123094]|uniref:Uncharacterized protein n=1 Tax=Amniculicola lignicola CBS 123094 TaxID=1392246 RepID=A0A6A5WIC1_9PLEO|nr:hypothetical protein P154DRAFT_574995 [Amniculicola lignicola CBS 123094]
MRSLGIILLFSDIFFSSYVSAQVDLFQAPDETQIKGWLSTCSSCASLQRLRASAFGIELAPNYVTLAMKFANGTVSRVLKVEPSDAYVAGMMSWVWEASTLSRNLEFGWEAVARRHQYTSVMTKELQYLLDEKERYYPVLDLEYGGISMPDGIYASSHMRSMILEALNATGIATARNKPFWRTIPTNYAVIAATLQNELGQAPSELQDPGELLGFDALVITNTTAILSAVWYQFSFVPRGIGGIEYVKTDMLPTVGGFCTSKISHIPSAQVNMTSIRAFVHSLEAQYKSRTGPGKRLMTGISRVILRLNSTETEKRYSFGHEVYSALHDTRFNPGSTKTTVVRDEEDSEAWLWEPALFIARKTKGQLNSSLPIGCYPDAPACKELNECIRQEANGELVLCEDVLQIPGTSFQEKLDTGVQSGVWGLWKSIVLHPTAGIMEETEARIWLAFCSPRMPWSDTAITSRCTDAITPLDRRDSDSELGVLDSYLGFSHSMLWALSEYFLGSPIDAMLTPTIFWLGGENLLKIFFWAVSRVLGTANYNATIEFVEEFWENSGVKEVLGPILEMFE